MNEDLILSHLSALYFRMHWAIIDSSQICWSYLAISILIELKEGFIDECLSFRIWLSSNTLQEFIIIDITIIISIKVIEKKFSFFLCDLHAEIFQSEIKLLFIDLSVPVIRINSFEWSSNTSDCTDSSCCELIFYSLEN